MINTVIIEGYIDYIIEQREATMRRKAYCSFKLATFNDLAQRFSFVCEAWGKVAERLLEQIKSNTRVVVFGSLVELPVYPTANVSIDQRCAISVFRVTELFDGKVINLEDREKEIGGGEPTIEEILEYHQKKEEQEELKEEPKEEPKQEPHYLYTDEDIENELKELERKQREETNE